MAYEPRPIETDEIKIPDHLKEVVEILAANQHDIWAMKKMESGYIYGEKNSEPIYKDGKVVTPGKSSYLVPYDELPEDIKDYDRANVLGTIRGLLKLGYSISK